MSAEGSGKTGPPLLAVPRFEPTDDAGIRSHLQGEGFVVVKGALTPDEVERGVGLFWDWAATGETLSLGTSGPSLLTAA